MIKNDDTVDCRKLLRYSSLAVLLYITTFFLQYFFVQENEKVSKCLFRLTGRTQRVRLFFFHHQNNSRERSAVDVGGR